jgi:glutaminyl-peptide cyclotransferase
MLEKNIKFLVMLFISSFLFLSCEENSKKKAVTPTISQQLIIPKFNRDSAFYFIEQQLSFGYRIPGTEDHIQCRDWIAGKLESYGAKVFIQDFRASFMDKKNVSAFNIIGEINPQAKNRIIIAAHWDTRMISEKDPDSSKREQPVMGADDGASGVAVGLELARLLSGNPVDIGVDFVFFDAEDQGENEGDGWCLGSIHWSSNKHRPGYTARYGVLLDMVGAKNAKFGREGWSQRFAPDLLDKLWNLAASMGYSDYFINTNTGLITDDHYYVNVNAKIPMINIINRPMKTDHGFGHYHHTHLDNLEIIDKRTLEVVGKVMTAMIYKENNRSF